MGTFRGSRRFFLGGTKVTSATAPPLKSMRRRSLFLLPTYFSVYCAGRGRAPVNVPLLVLSPVTLKASPASNENSPWARMS